MEIAILYESTHHGNTKKLCDAIKAKYDVALIDATQEIPDLSDYDLLGLASGIAFSKFYKTITAAAEKHIPAGKKLFFLYTCGSPGKDFSANIRRITESKGCKSLGTYGCKGFDTYGPFKLVGGINKHSPTADDIQDAVTFFDKVLESA